MNTQDIAIAFEARKISMRQNKEGFILVLGIHPNDLPQSLITSWVGSIWQVGMVQVGDDGMPIVPPEKKERAEAVARAGLLCRNERFQIYLANRYPEFCENIFAETPKQKEREKRWKKKRGKRKKRRAPFFARH